jgi:hypothetical protein
MKYLLLLCATLCGVGCAAHPTTITAEPDGVFISVNGTAVGQAPTAYTFDFGKLDAYEVKGTKTGYFDSAVTVNANTTLPPSGLHVALQQDSSWNETATTAANNTWLRIQISPDLQSEAMWQKLIDTVTNRYSSIEQMDVASGYLRSVMVIKTYHHPMGGDFRIRTQFTGAVASKEPLIYKVKIVSERSDAPGQWQPFERVFKEDAQMVDELQTRLGAK